MHDGVVTNATIKDILRRNSAVEAKLLEAQADSPNQGLGHCTVKDFLKLSCPELQDFIHARKFSGKTFQKTKLSGIIQSY